MAGTAPFALFKVSRDSTTTDTPRPMETRVGGGGGGDDDGTRGGDRSRRVVRNVDDASLRGDWTGPMMPFEVSC